MFNDVQLIFLNGASSVNTDNIVVNTFDICGDILFFGGFKDLFDIRFIQLNETKNIEVGVVNDNEDGSYNIELQTKVAGSYSIVITFGEGCNLVESDGLVTLSESSPTNCFFETNDNFIVATVFPRNEEEAEEFEINIEYLSGGGILCIILLLVELIVYQKQNRKLQRIKNLHKILGKNKASF